MSSEPLSILHKHRKTRNFTQIENATLRDAGLSFRATGLHAYLLSLPTGSRIDSTTLSERKKEGRDAIRSAYRELEGAGYVWRERHQDDDGKWRTTIHVYEVPKTDSQASGIQSSDNRASVSQAVSLTESKTENKEQGSISLVCRECSATGFATADALADHIEFGCEAMRDEDGDFATAREALRKAGGRGG